MLLFPFITIFVQKKFSYEGKALRLAAVFAMIAFGAVAQETSTPEKITVINGKFFRKLPEGVAKMMTPDGIKVSSGKAEPLLKYVYIH
ncbi:hypothetical protein [Bacteroides fluxus]|mgnify:FL=1|uniref:hypothetical protein n=1 Tax=Bacteroides fluxus TaxID=626930 RepID=UPI0023F3FD94|nr:hypothetical protein [Bacteroides fluxus]